MSKSKTKAGIINTPRWGKVQAKVSKTRARAIKMVMGVFFTEDIAAN
jgi:hypothetical protein